MSLLTINLGGGYQMRVLDGFSHLTAQLVHQNVVLRSREDSGNDARDAAHRLLDDLIDHTLTVSPARPTHLLGDLLSRVDLAELITSPRRDEALPPLGVSNLAAAIDGLEELFHAEAERYQDDHCIDPDKSPDPDGARREQQCLAALDLAIRLFKLLQERQDVDRRAAPIGPLVTFSGWQREGSREVGTATIDIHEPSGAGTGALRLEIPLMYEGGVIRAQAEGTQYLRNYAGVTGEASGWTWQRERRLSIQETLTWLQVVKFHVPDPYETDQGAA